MPSITARMRVGESFLTRSATSALSIATTSETLPAHDYTVRYASTSAALRGSPQKQKPRPEVTLQSSYRKYNRVAKWYKPRALTSARAARFAERRTPTQARTRTPAWRPRASPDVLPRVCHAGRNHRTSSCQLVVCPAGAARQLQLLVGRRRVLWRRASGVPPAPSLRPPPDCELRASRGGCERRGQSLTQFNGGIIEPDDALFGVDSDASFYE